MRYILMIMCLAFLLSSAHAATYADTSSQFTGDFYAEAFLSNPNPYVGEQVIYTMRYYAYDIERISSANPVNLPDFQRFWVGDIFNLRPTIESINGVQYNVGELAVELVPLTAGQVTIQPAELLINETPFLPGGTFATTPLVVDVRPLPQDAPPSFNGAVGQYAMRAEIDRIGVDVGQPIRLIVDVQGTGNFTLLPSPPLNLGDNWRVISGTPQIPEQPDRTLINLPFGRRVFEWLLIPLQSGTLEISDIRFSYFDPTREIYVESDAWNFTVNVFPAEGNIRNFNAGLASAPQLALKPIDLQDMEEASYHYPSWILWIVPPLIAGIIGVVQFYRWQRALIRQRRRRIHALKRAIQRLTELKNQPAERVSRGIQNIIRAYIGDKFGTASPLVNEITYLLDHKNFPETQLEQTDQAILQAQSLSYMPSPTEEDKARVIDLARQALIGLEREWRKL